ncbi:MAG: DUF1836 domain-containing protein [Tyzzerella sp.]|uniref:DUF1836 domain-containing protein n=1 Tax=Candidatus Fimicola merdigallinarum TaxID=2840819 RepID=A0A9D9H2S7_9FIRM|nr:DUF1836 domain-containing protein [Candidatus Fimicola merdigallinarum]
MEGFIKNLEVIINESIKEETIELSDIPNIDLYMDQVTTFMEESLKSYKRYPVDKVLTKTMINNYAKAKLFPSPLKKKYTKNHLMLLVIIYHLKSILSINDINKLLKPITENIVNNEKSTELETLYKYFTVLQKTSRKNDFILSEIQNEILTEDSIKNKENIMLILTVLLSSIKANQEKRIAEKILDKFFV